MLTLARPTLLLDKDKCLKNITRIVEKANRFNVRLRPHFKTHQSHEIGRWFRVQGVDSCTVSSLQMAEYFARDGWKDITVAFPLNYLEADLINRLASQLKLNLCVTAQGTLSHLKDKLNHPVHIYIEIDTGYHRTGIDPKDDKSISNLFSEIASSPNFVFEGFLSHAGHSYKCKTRNHIQHVHDEEVNQMVALREKYKNQFPQLQLSIGDTPSASLCENFYGIDEMRPGNLVFYDLTQFHIGSCKLDQIAVALTCPVVATYPERNEIVIYGGGVHFSKDALIEENGKPVYGYVVRLKEGGWVLPPTSMRIQSLSQEHGIIYAPDGEASSVKPGEVLGVLPVHSCLTADAMGEYLSLDGEKIARFS